MSDDRAQPRSRRAWPPWTVFRDVSLFVGGMLGVVHETVLWTGAERPTLLLLFGAMMGLPAFLRSDERHR